jgi:hypothetical protein
MPEAICEFLSFRIQAWSLSLPPLTRFSVMLLLIFIIAFFHVLINSAFDPLINYLPITLASQSERVEGPYVRSMSTIDEKATTPTTPTTPISDSRPYLPLNLSSLDEKTTDNKPYLPHSLDFKATRSSLAIGEGSGTFQRLLPLIACGKAEAGGKTVGMSPITSYQGSTDLLSPAGINRSPTMQDDSRYDQEAVADRHAFDHPSVHKPCVIFFSPFFFLFTVR